MIAVDTSALVAVVLGEPDAERHLAALQSQPAVVSAASLVEALVVVEARQGPEAAHDLRALVRGLGIEMVPCDGEQAELATAAWRRFGKGRHPAGLNLGDCYSYALARSRGLPLLFKGDDFAQTDLPAA